MRCPQSLRSGGLALAPCTPRNRGGGNAGSSLDGPDISDEVRLLALPPLQLGDDVADADAAAAAAAAVLDAPRKRAPRLLYAVPPVPERFDPGSRGTWATGGCKTRPRR